MSAAEKYIDARHPTIDELIAERRVVFPALFRARLSSEDAGMAARYDHRLQLVEL